MPSAVTGRFRDQRQRARVCRALLARVSRSAFWGLEGPRPEAHVAPSFETDADVRLLLSVCWTIWNGASTLTVSDLLGLRSDRLAAVAELLGAMARDPDAVDRWLEAQEPRGRPRPEVGRARHEGAT